MIGGAIGLTMWLVGFSGDLLRPGILFIWPMGLGGFVSLVGESDAKIQRIFEK
jgi:hypothetical protein